jgi:DNA-binding FrmR family transcriptional regulator
MQHDHEYLHEHNIPHVHHPDDVHDEAKAHLHSHEHAHDHAHGAHPHVHENTKAVLNRLSRAIGHLESVKKMVENGRDCSEVLIQIAAVRSAINNIGKVILQDHIQHCLVDAVENDDEQALDDLCQAIDKFIK